ncbi:DJ-1/PfpI family protein [uncultured Psychrobacter sp.]|uniref:DJ-1/PfpI family protein n=1 Tax=uncultured Psychrobacter sp. TaxID=259303 RepID=UPI00260C5B37|nr:DJ-1/PfpI family protein [uncultured Psychrobacter sp.]
MQTITALLFDNFETLDLFGPIQMFGSLPEHYRIQYSSLLGGVISNNHGIAIQTTAIAELDYSTVILLIVGGMGTRQKISDSEFLQALVSLSTHADWVLSVCTGSALLAKAGVLDNRKATSNKLALQWASTQSEQVHWVQEARWVVDGKFYTSSGVSAGIDMALGFIADRHGIKTAQRIANYTEYHWQQDSKLDSFYEP